MSKLARVNPKQIRVRLPKTRFVPQLFPTAMNVPMIVPARNAQMDTSFILVFALAGLRFAMPKVLRLRQPKDVKTRSSSSVIIANVLESLRPLRLFSL